MCDDDDVCPQPRLAVPQPMSAWRVAQQIKVLETKQFNVQAAERKAELDVKPKLVYSLAIVL